MQKFWLDLFGINTPIAQKYSPDVDLEKIMHE